MKEGVIMEKTPTIIIWSRICLICLWVFAIAAFCRYFIFIDSSIFSYIAIGAILLAFLIKFIILRCSNCGLSGGVPQWSANKITYCARCGKPFYDIK